MESIGAAGGPIQDPPVVVTTVPDYREAVSAKANSMTILPSDQLFLPASRFKSLPEIGDANDWSYISSGYAKAAGRLTA
jgi:hypothetical protein